MADQLYDCMVVGGAPVGLSTALILARYCRRVLVIHHNSPRNLYSHGVHGFPGHHGILPAELLERGREEVVRHSGMILEFCVTGAERLAADCFRTTVGAESPDGGSPARVFEARRLLLATGLSDVTPDLPGFREFYGRSVFHCPDCDGYEVGGRRVAVLGGGKSAVAFTLGLLTWTRRLTLVVDGDPAESLKGQAITVSVSNGEASLIGSVRSESNKRSAAKIAKQCRAKTVNNALAVDPAAKTNDTKSAEGEN